MKRSDPPVRSGRATRALLRLGIATAAVAPLFAFATPEGAPGREPGAVVDVPSVDRAIVPAAEATEGVATFAPVLLDPTLEPVRGRPAGTDTYDAGAAPFPLTVDGTHIDYEVFAVAALPGGTLRIAPGAPAGTDGYQLRHATGHAVVEAGSWTWTAPEEPGIHPLTVSEGAEGPAVRLHVLVAHPAASIRGDALNGYRIGRYVETPLGGRDAYLPPEGFVEVAAANEDVLVSPHFTLGQFLCKQEGDPRYVAFSAPLVAKLEAVLAEANRSGVATGTFHVMSGFRTPWYNAAIGNKTVYSRHLWGDAADIFVDVDGDSDMDDLNGDGRADTADARVLAGIVERVEARAEGRLPLGGIGIYKRNSAHGPFVHVDARGYSARW